jgi:hypothetical protein
MDPAGTVGQPERCEHCGLVNPGPEHRANVPLLCRERYVEPYPEHEKLRGVHEVSQAIGEFLDLGPWTLCRVVPETGEMHAHYEPVEIQAALAEYFEIDRAKIDAEKAAMLDALRAANA